MSLAPVGAHDGDIHGLTYAPAFLDVLPVLQHRAPPHQPIRALSASQFSRVHLDYATSHAPDGVLFPFLHGLEGNNAAQNAFFAGSPQAHDVPRFRGLIWVACDDDDDANTPASPDTDTDTDDDLLDDDDCSSASSLESVEPMPMDMDVDHPMLMELDAALSGSDDSNCPPSDLSAKTSPAALSVSAGTPQSTPSILVPHTPRISRRSPAVLTSSFRPRELLHLRKNEDGSESCVFVEPRVPDGISLRNFGIQMHVFATISDIVVYSPKGNTHAAFALAEKFKDAVEAKRAERAVRYPSADLVAYNIFVLEASPAEMEKTMPHLLVRMQDVPLAHTDGTDAHTEGEVRSDSDTEALLCANTVDFARREKEEMRDLTQASEIISIADPEIKTTVNLETLSGSTTATHWEPALGQIYVGNSNDVPLPADRRIRVRHPRTYTASYGDDEDEDVEEAFDWRSNDPNLGLGYDICIECHDFAPFPTSAHVRAAEEHLSALERKWTEHCVAELSHLSDEEARKTRIAARPPAGASSVIHLPFPSSPPSTATMMNALAPFIAFLEGLLQPPAPLTLAAARAQLAPPPRPPMPPHVYAERRASGSGTGFMPSSLPPPSSFPSSFFPSSPVATSSAYTRTRSTSATFLSSSVPSPAPSSSGSSSSSPSTASYASSGATSQTSTSMYEELVPLRTRPCKILIYSADGYTESSVLALTLLMALRGISLPEAYLTLQNEKRRSFFVYPADLPVLKRIEARMERERGKERKGRGVVLGSQQEKQVDSPAEIDQASEGGDAIDCPAATEKSVSFAIPPTSRGLLTAVTVRPLRSQSESDKDLVAHGIVGTGRPRASTMPNPSALLSMHNHQVWFNDPRFDGSFPSRVLPFLYLGNLNHATNAYMLHALGITHVVSVGECALMPPPNLQASTSESSCAYAGVNPNAQFIPGHGPHGHGSLFVEEREGRIKVLDIQGVCDDGIDTLEPQLEPICEWIDRARQDGGKVLVHCRVGVSRSATVTIAYVMKHLNLPLVDAYLIVRSRRLSVLIQPNMRLLYNLLGWEVKLARQRAGDNERKLQGELARSLNWPYLAKEVHALNEKYLH
ncbi:uncharacterized protein LAESUDRAFT_730433 [Laetiporus sulphureus 93-53]|uniref:Uncharacterized protein n=1 Tax=Laetiporus sulphureus 93-53 TaxID=1314785 RepID=A0A165C5Q3_9APHY|nr:uncharacterized protein LAESUDRAFT_730433 [Laetiporus sulphureus 93-53]KZT02250.1 hypothetical protein LAESUDRAFT_730433 [Laetiporus sulphureus 93-53]